MPVYCAVLCLYIVLCCACAVYCVYCDVRVYCAMLCLYIILCSARIISFVVPVYPHILLMLTRPILKVCMLDHLFVENHKEKLSK